MPKETMKLSFSIQGEFITRAARERFYYNKDLPGAIELLQSCLVSDELSEAQTVALALAILDGRKEIKGVYPGDEYGVYDVPEDKRPKQDIVSFFQKLDEEQKKLQKTNSVLMDKLACIAENLEDFQMSRIDTAWRTQWVQGDSDDRSIFGTNPTGAEGISEAVKDILGEDDPGGKLLVEYAERMASPCDEPDYGWLFPDGSWFPVDFGSHMRWALDWLKEHDPEWEPKARAKSKDPVDYSDANEVLMKKYGAILLHNPGMGVGKPHSRKEPTKAQKEFLFDYYQKRGHKKLASEVYDEDRDWTARW